MAERTLASYRAIPKAQHTHGLEAFEAALETVAQAQALRGDFLDREAKLRQAADLVDDATNRADAVLYALDEKKRSAERAAEAAAQARAQTCETLAVLETKHADLLAATRSARGARGAADEAQQAHHQLTAEMATAKLDLQSVLEEARLTREEVRVLQERSRPFAPSDLGEVMSGIAPGIAPGAFASVPVLYPAGPTLLSFLYGLVTNAATGALQLTGGTLTGELDITLTSGPAWQFTNTPAVRSGAFGMTFNKAKALDTNPHSLIWEVGANPTWEIGQDFDTNNSDGGGTGNSDFVTCFDHTANAGAGADVMRFSPAEKDSVGNPKSTKMNYGGGGVGTPRDNTVLWNVTASAGLGGISLNINSATARDHLTLVQSHVTSKRAAIDLNSQWYIAVDVGGTGASNLTFRDKVNSLNRLYLENTANLLAKLGWNTGAPVGNLHSASSADASLYNTPQPLLVAGGSALANRCWNVTQIVDNDGTHPVTTQVWLSGTAGSTSTRATPTSTSTNDKGAGILYTGDIARLFCATIGTNQPIVPAFSWRYSGADVAAQIGWFGATEVIKQVGASAAGIGAIADAPAKAAITAIQNALAAYGLLTAPA